MPPALSGYVIGDGDAVGNAIRPTSGTSWLGEGTRLIHRARAANRRPTLMIVEDASDVRIAGFEIEGGRAVREGILFSGVVERIALEDLRFADLVAYAITYGDRSTDPERARFDDVRLDRIAVTRRSTGGSRPAGMNFFPRAQSGDRPPPATSRSARPTSTSRTAASGCATMRPRASSSTTSTGSRSRASG